MTSGTLRRQPFFADGIHGVSEKGSRIRMHLEIALDRAVLDPNDFVWMALVVLAECPSRIKSRILGEYDECHPIPAKGDEKDISLMALNRIKRIYSVDGELPDSPREWRLRRRGG